MTKAITINKQSGVAALMVAAMLFAFATPVFADSGSKGEGDNGLHLGQYLGARIKHDVGVGFGKHMKEHATSTKNEDREKKENYFARIASTTIGVVTSVNGALFTVDPFGPKSTTTVTTDSSTVFKVRGGATTSAALSEGSRIIVIGTTTATSTSGTSVTASLVIILQEGFRHFWHWFHH